MPGKSGVDPGPLTQRVISMWYLDEDCELQNSPTTAAIGLTFRRDRPFTKALRSGYAVVVQPVGAITTASAVVFVPDRWTGRVFRNGLPLPPGMHPLRHADQLVGDEQTYWVSAQAPPVHTQYDPATHGDDVRCVVTKARLAIGQEITICPGLPGVPCGTIYKAAAWEKIMRPGSPVKCSACGYRPELASWEPTAPTPREIDHDYLKYFA